MVNELKKKILLCVLLTVAIGFYVWVYMKWKTCPVIDCSHELVNNVLRTVGPGALYLIAYFIPFLFLPPHYFKTWFKYIFSWAFPLTVYLVYITTGSSSIPAYGKDDVVRFWGMVYAVVTVAFIIFHYIKTRKQNKLLRKKQT